MDTTLVAVYENAGAAGQALRVVQERRLAREVMVLTRRGDGPEQGTNPVITGPGYVPDTPADAPDGEDRLGGGAALGATLGGTLGLLAATYGVVGPGALPPAGPLVSTLVGAGLGSVVGALFESESTGPASLHPGTVRLGGVLLVAVCSPEQAPSCREVLQGWGALDVRAQPAGPAGAGPE